MSSKHLKEEDIVFTNIGHAIKAVDTNQVVTTAEFIYDVLFEISGETGFTQQEINQYLLSHGGGGGGVDPEQVKEIIYEYLNDNGYITSGETFEMVSTMIDDALENYYTKAEIDEKLKNIVVNIEGKDGISVEQTKEKTTIGLDYFDGGVINI